MAEILTGISLFSVFLTLALFLLGQFLQKKTRSPLLNPILFAAAALIGCLLLLKIPNEEYQAGCKAFSWLLTPATVCLAIPLYEQIQALRKSLPAILLGVFAGTVTSLGSIFLLCRLFSLDRALTVSLLPKSITTAMGVVLSEQLGGIGAITTAVIILTGILGSIFGPLLCRLFRLKDPIAQGVGFGTASHVIGTSKACELSPLTGAVSSLSLVVAGLITALLLSFLPI